MRLRLAFSALVVFAILVGSNLVYGQSPVCPTDDSSCIYLPVVKLHGTPGITPTTAASHTATASINATSNATILPTASATPSLVVVAPTAIIAPSSTTIPIANVAIVSSNAFVPYTGSNSLYIVGEVRNDTNSVVEFIQINAVLRNAAGTIVDGNYSYSAIDKLTTGMTSPFLIIFSNTPTWSSYELTVTGSVTDVKPYELQIITPEDYFDSSDAYHVRGKAKNQDTIPHTFVQLFLTMYDQNNNVIGVADGYTNPTTLNPGQEVPFDLSAFFWKYKPDRSKVVHYSIRSYDD